MTTPVFDPLTEVEALEQLEFLELARFNEGAVGVFWADAGATGPWERHPHCEELLMVLEGEVEVEILPEDGGPAEVRRLRSGAATVVPRRCWHRHIVRKRTKELYLTPGVTEHSRADDPRSNASE